jgi:5-hydroxyisourate hydrolase-like protein (transthyretin family)
MTIPVSLLLTVLVCDSQAVYAQVSPDTVIRSSDSSAQADAVVEEEASMYSPSIEFTTVQKGSDQFMLSAVLRSKIQGVLYKLPHLKVVFFQVVGEEEKMLGTGITDRNGRAQLTVPTNKLELAGAGELSFKARYAGHKQMEAAEEELTIRRAQLLVTPVKQDSSYQVQIKLLDLSTSDVQPIKEATIGLYVERSFMPLKIGEGTTDESGELTLEVAAGLPGDEKGMLSLFARVEENEALGGVETKLSQPWGLPASEARKKQPSTLWTATPPLWMLVTFIVLLTVVWGHYLVIIVQLIRLRKEEPGYHDQAV